jgi:hypothetical protein
MARKPSLQNPNPPKDPRDNASYDNGVWYSTTGKVIGHSQREDSPFLPGLTSKPPKTAQRINKHNPDWHLMPTINRFSNVKSNRHPITGMSNVRKKAYNKLRKNA